MKYSTILFLLLICANCFSQRINDAISHARSFEKAEEYFERGENDIARQYFLVGSKSMLEYIDQKYHKGEPTLTSFQNWLEWQKKLADIFNQWYNTLTSKYHFIELSSVVGDLYRYYYITAKPLECESESGYVGMEYKGIKELAAKYGNEELVDYFDIKIDEPRKGDGYDCEGQSTDFEKPLMVLKKCENFIEKYPDSKYKDEVQNISEIAQSDYQRLKERYEMKRKHSKNDNNNM